MSNNRHPSRFIFVGLALIVVLGGATYWAWDAYSQAHDAAVHAYLLSVCAAIEEHRTLHGEYPANLSQIGTAKLDHDMGIPLSDLRHDVRNSTITVTYQPRGDRTIVGTRKVVPKRGPLD